MVPNGLEVTHIKVCIDGEGFMKEVRNKHGDIYTDKYKLYWFGANIYQDETECNIPREIEFGVDNVDFYLIAKHIHGSNTNVTFKFQKNKVDVVAVVDGESYFYKGRHKYPYHEKYYSVKKNTIVDMEDKELLDKIMDVDIVDIMLLVCKSQNIPPIVPDNPEIWIKKSTKE